MPRRKPPTTPLTPAQLELFNGCVPLAHKIASRVAAKGGWYRRLGDLDDLHQEAMCLLMELTQKYQGERAAFTTYVSNFLGHHLVRNMMSAGFVAVPHNVLFRRRAERYRADAETALNLNICPIGHYENGDGQECFYDPPDHRQSITEEMPTTDEVRHLRREIGRLPEHERYVVEENMLRGRVYRELTAESGLKKSMLTYYRRRALARLRKALAG